MPVEALPGRPGTLTPEQEAKLHQFWQVTLKVFGVYGGNGGYRFNSINGVEVGENNGEADMTSSDIQQKQEADSRSLEKKKKKKSFFSRKRPQKDSETQTASATSDATSNASTFISPTVEENDKYGQTKEFQQALASQTPEDLRAVFWNMVKHDHPDGLLLRFLRARKWDVERALVMLVSTMHWRGQDMHVDDDVIKAGEGGALEATKSPDIEVKKEAEDFLAQLRIGKSYLHGLDKHDRPICVIKVRLHRQGEQSERSLERYTVYLIETARMLLAPPVDTAALLFDMTNFSLANMDYAPVKFMIKCFEANYPESLGIVVVHKAPWIFQGIWTIIRGWLDPVVAAKVHFTRSLEELEEFIPRDHIAKELGGDEDWSYNYAEPYPDENVRMSDEAAKRTLFVEREEIVKEFETITMKWIAPSTGIDERADTLAKRNELAESLRKNYWQLDPYIRARTIYDRIGVITDGGKIKPYPGESIMEKNPALIGHETSPDDVD
ncbi:hypothetical protein FGG08_001779 [Glutinoglossum americanum]|uniref:CRAL-TRIO domain-containing protein n=1 Tax=Glutinoglossum americanum TaxID=1670608 RepID=A0A9P8L527_9PEZI|nr:hypothetical protein FGG08_001779 [Glutinoglossum americanum]